jgi:hypothetical protein
MWLDWRLLKHARMRGINGVLKWMLFPLDVLGLIVYHVRKPMTDFKLRTRQIQWMPKQTITTSQVALTTTTMKDANVPSDAWNISPAENSVELRFLCDTNDQGGTVRIYGQKKTGLSDADSDVVLVASLAVTAGGQETVRDGVTMYYVDTIVVTNAWMKNIATADNDGNNRMARVGFDALGYRSFFARIEFSGSHTWLVESTGF